MSEPFFRIEHLTKRFGGLMAVNDVGFEMARDQVVGLIGPNGAGKTTLLRLITRILRPDQGRVVFNGEDITSLRPWDVVNRGIAGTFQTTRPFRHLPIIANVMVPLLRASYYVAAAWQFGVALILAGLAFAAARSSARGVLARLAPSLAPGAQPKPQGWRPWLRRGRREMLRGMKKGSVFVDVAVDSPRPGSGSTLSSRNATENARAKS